MALLLPDSIKAPVDEQVERQAVETGACSASSGPLGAPGMIPTLACLIPLLLFTPANAGHADPDPGPLAGGQNGVTFRGPGFDFLLPPHWSVELDDIPAGEGIYGERGTASGRAFREDETAPLATIRFEPFPRGGLPPGHEPPSLDDFKAHIQRTLARDRPIGTLPLLTRAAMHDDMVNPPELRGIQLHFTRPAPDGDPARQQRFFVYALLRADGRLQAIICSHFGEPGIRRYSGMFMGVAERFTTTWPEATRLIRRDDLGFAVQVPRGWRPAEGPACGAGYLNRPRDPRRRFDTIVRLALPSMKVDPPIEALVPIVTPTVEFQFAQLYEGTVDEWQRDSGGHEQFVKDAPREFIFADGARGHIIEWQYRFTVVRQHGPGMLIARAGPVLPQTRAAMLELIAGVQLFEPDPPEPITTEPGDFTFHGITITRPRAWQVTRAAAHPFIAAIEPTEPAQPGLYSPGLSLSIWRLDDILAERKRMREPPAPLPSRVREIPHEATLEDLPFFTDTGWDGWLWRDTTTYHGRRQTLTVLAIQYTLPLPDGVLALVMSGQLSITPDTRELAETIEKAWHTTAQSARMNNP
jgi:hypothetical protein